MTIRDSSTVANKGAESRPSAPMEEEIYATAQPVADPYVSGSGVDVPYAHATSLELEQQSQAQRPSAYTGTGTATPTATATPTMPSIPIAVSTGAPPNPNLPARTYPAAQARRNPNDCQECCNGNCCCIATAIIGGIIALCCILPLIAVISAGVVGAGIVDDVMADIDDEVWKTIPTMDDTYNALARSDFWNATKNTNLGY
eukprot:jgi/Psemu1/21546/gm1.21546_g